MSARSIDDLAKEFTETISSSFREEEASHTHRLEAAFEKAVDRMCKDWTPEDKRCRETPEEDIYINQRWL